VIRDTGVVAIAGERNAFTLRLSAGDEVRARRILLATGMVDEMLPIEGFPELWGHSIFQCPYCHGWEIQDQRWGFLVQPAHAALAAPFALMARGFTTRGLTVFGDLPEDVCAQLRAADIAIAAAPVRRLVARDGQLTAVELADGTALACERCSCIRRGAGRSSIAWPRGRGRLPQDRSDDARDLARRHLRERRPHHPHAERHHRRRLRHAGRCDDQHRAIGGPRGQMTGA
jgi:hypothetical protein